MKIHLSILMFLVLLFGCSRRTAFDIYQEGKTAEEQKNFPVAIEKYQEVVDKFAQEAYAESSLFSMAMIYSNNLRNHEMAAKTYQKLYQLFPESENAPMAMFLAGFIYNNELKKIDTAKVIYELFLEKYSTHELAPSAKFELENLGKDPIIAIQPDIPSEEQTPSKKERPKLKK